MKHLIIRSFEKDSHAFNDFHTSFVSIIPKKIAQFINHMF